MPWDDDIDVMLNEPGIHHLAAGYNMTVHTFFIPSLDVSRSYLLEVNPHYSNATIDADNAIDARWIDMESGLFIDITTIRRNRTADALGMDGEMMVKDRHHYFYDDIFPLRWSAFEGVKVRIPFAYTEVLVEEYGHEALTRRSFGNYFFDQERREWISFG
jgi:phosphorylcholine metabolism protein LicD